MSARVSAVALMTLVQSAWAAPSMTAEQAHRYMDDWRKACASPPALKAKLDSCLDKDHNRPDACTDIIRETAYGERPRDVTRTFQPDGATNLGALAKVQDLVNKVVADSPLPALNGTLESFVPILQPNFLQPVTGGELEEPQTLGLSINFDRLLWFKLRVGGFLDPIPKMNAALKDTLVARGQLDRFSQRETSLDPGDDYYFVADLTLLGPWLGRDSGDHSEARSRLMKTILAGRDVGDGVIPYQEFDNVIAALPALDDDQSRTDVACAAELYLRVTKQADARLAESKLPEFWKLLNNQPQFLFSYRQLHRDEIVGADATTYRFKFTTGILNNVDWLKLLPGCGFDLSQDSCPGKFNDMVDGFAVKYGLGLAAYFEWGNIADLSVMLPSLTNLPNPLPPIQLPIQLPIISTVLGDEIQIKGGGYRRYGWSVGGTFKHPDPADAFPTSIRLDAGMDFYRYEGNSLRLNHNVGRITLTYRRGPFSFPLHLMYRTKTELQAHVAKDLVVGLGTEMNFSQW